MAPLRWMAGLGLLASLSLVPPTQAQDLPFDQPDDLVSELVVKARTPGPAWWKVSDADTTVWILGSPGKVPVDLKWDDSVLRRRLTGANSLILPPTATASLLGVVGFGATIKKQISDPRSLDKRMPQQLAQRAMTVLQPSDTGKDAAGAKPKAKISVSPKTVFLAMLILDDADKPLGKLVEEPRTRASSLAKSLKVKVVRSGEYDGLAAMKATLAMPDEAQNACLAAALDVAEAGAAEIEKRRVQARAWADGDVPAALRRRDVTDMSRVCPPPPAVRTINAAASNAAVSTLQGALGKSGHAVAVVELDELLRAGGVLERLKAKGYTVTAPDVLND